MMSLKKAVQIAEECILYYIRKELAVDANIHENYGASYPRAAKCSDKRKKYLVAINVLKQTLGAGLFQEWDND